MVRKVVLLTAAAMFVVGAAFASPDDKGKKKKVTHVTVCPMTGKEVKAEGPNCKMEGKNCVHFCCGDCPAAFEKLSKKEQEAKIKAAMHPAKTKKAEAGGSALVVVNTCPMTGEDAKSAAGGTCKVGNYEVHFCCAGCKAPFEKMTVAEQEAKIKSVLKKG